MKQVIVVRSDLGMSTGKLVAQACHASLGAYRNAESAVRDEWLASGATKIAVSAESEEALTELCADAQRRGVSTYVVKDAGETELSPGTRTALGVGPADDEAVDAVTGELPLL